MLIAMLTVFLLGGGLMGGAMLTSADVDLIETRVELAVEDPARNAEALQVVAELRAEVEDFDQVFFESGEQLREIYRDHEAGSRQMLQTLEQLNLAWYASQSRGMVMRDRLRESMTAEEWSAVFADR